MYCDPIFKEALVTDVGGMRSILRLALASAIPVFWSGTGLDPQILKLHCPTLVAGPNPQILDPISVTVTKSIMCAPKVLTDAVGSAVSSMISRDFSTKISVAVGPNCALLRH